MKAYKKFKKSKKLLNSQSEFRISDLTAEHCYSILYKLSVT